MKSIKSARPVAMLVALSLGGCAETAIAPPALPTPTTIQAANVDIARLSSNPTQTFHAGIRIARAACETYLNQKAMQAAQLNQTGAGAGALGVGLSAINPLAGIASSLFQTFLTAYQAAGVMPYTNETSSVVLGAMNAYENNAGTPPDNDTAVSWVDDAAFYCTPAGYAELVSQAISTAQIGTSGGAAAALALPFAPRRSVVTINGHPVP